MAANSSPSGPDLRIVADVSPARLHGEACFTCGSTEPPLHPAGTVGTRVDDVLVREWPIVVCTVDREAAR